MKVYSSGSALDGGPAMYLHRSGASLSPCRFPRDRGLHAVRWHSPARGSRPPARRRVPDLLVSGAAGVLKYDLVRPNAQARTLQAVRIGVVHAGPGALLGGN